MRDSATPRTSCFLALAVGIAAVGGCAPAATAPPGSSANSKPSAAVGVLHPQRQALQRVVEQPGTVEAYEETRLFARVSGYVRLFLDKEGRIIHDIGRKIHGPKYDSSGKEVEPGEVLAEVMVPELEQQSNLKKALVRQAAADVEQAEKAVAAAEANIATTDAVVVEARALKDRWESESKRFASLTKTGTIDEQSGAETLNQYKAAAARVLSTEAAVRKAKADRDKAQADVRSMQARVAVAEAAAQEAATMQGYAKIRAPYDGVVTVRKVKTGTFVQPTDGPENWLFRVAQVDPIRVVIAVPEADAELVKIKDEVKLTIQALRNPNLRGTVARTSGALDPVSRTLRTEIDVPNKDGLIRPGMYVYARITSPLPESWTLPTSAVVKHGDTLVCYLIEDGKAVRTPVQVGRGDGQFIAVLKRQKPGAPPVWEEFTGNETIAAHANGLTDGQTIEREKAGK